MISRFCVCPPHTFALLCPKHGSVTDTSIDLSRANPACPSCKGRGYEDGGHETVCDCVLEASERGREPASTEPEPMSVGLAIEARSAFRRGLLDGVIGQLLDPALPNSKLRELRLSLELAEQIGREIGELMEREAMEVTK
jgi:hypothetical protein